MIHGPYNVKLFICVFRSCITYVMGVYVVSAVYLILSSVYLRCIRSIYTNFILSCRCYPCFVFYTNYLIIKYLTYSYVEIHAQFCYVYNLRLNM